MLGILPEHIVRKATEYLLKLKLLLIFIFHKIIILVVSFFKDVERQSNASAVVYLLILRAAGIISVPRFYIMSLS